MLITRASGQETEQAILQEVVPQEHVPVETLDPAFDKQGTEEEVPDPAEGGGRLEREHQRVLQEEHKQEKQEANQQTGGSSSNINSNTNHPQQHHPATEEAHCAWGTACHAEKHKHGSETGSIVEEDPEKVSGSATGQEEKAANTNHHHHHHHHPQNGENASTGGSTAAGGGIPFVKHHPSNPVAPPEGFTITARVYTDPHDKLAHFTDDAEGSHVSLPYWECGATGSTTSPLPIKHAYFRHALGGSKPSVWSGSEYGPHPQLIVALSSCVEITLNSGEIKRLKSGDVVLLEDVVSGGHKCTSCGGSSSSSSSGAGDAAHHHHHHHQNAEGNALSYLVLTLPQHYHHVGRDRMSLKRASMEKKVSPCDATMEQQQRQQNKAGSGKSPFVGRQKQAPGTKQNQDNDDLSTPSWDRIAPGGGSGSGSSSTELGPVSPLQEGKVRKFLLGAVGLSLTTLMADFLGKVAPLWVAVGIGGTTFVAGGTYATVQGGDYLWTHVETWRERRRLELSYAVEDDIEKEEDEMNKDSRKGNGEKTMPKPKPAAMAS